MYQFVETICIREGEPRLVDYHQARLNRTFVRYFPGYEPFDLSLRLSEIDAKTGIIKCRFLYNQENFELDLQPYKAPVIKSLKVICASNINYSYKTIDRSQLAALYALRGVYDDIIIINDRGQVTDSYFANLVFFDGKEWLTPDSCLLPGVKRQYLIDQGILKVRPITHQDLPHFEKVSLINAMMDIGEVEVNRENLVI